MRGHCRLYVLQRTITQRKSERNSYVQNSRKQCNFPLRRWLRYSRMSAAVIGCSSRTPASLRKEIKTHFIALQRQEENIHGLRSLLATRLQKEEEAEKKEEIFCGELAMR